MVETSGLMALIEMYVNDLQNGQEMHFAYEQSPAGAPRYRLHGCQHDEDPDYDLGSCERCRSRRRGHPVAGDRMIERSENDPADRLMEQVMDKNLGPLDVTEDLQAWA
jgi:beta-lactamase class A